MKSNCSKCIQIDRFNSDVFGLKMANINGCKEYKDYKKLLESDEFNKYQHISVKVNTVDIRSCNYLLKKGFYFVDTLISYKYNYLCDINKDMNIQGVIVGKVQQKDIEQLEEIASCSFKYDRFHNDPNLPDEKCDIYYKNWIRNSCEGYADIVLCARSIDNEILGYITARTCGERYAVIDLNAVKESARGRGIYTLLVNEIIKYYHGKVSEIRVGTQINTYAAQKTWCKLKFKVYDSKYVLHWYNHIA